MVDGVGDNLIPVRQESGHPHFGEVRNDEMFAKGIPDLRAEEWFPRTLVGMVEYNGCLERPDCQGDCFRSADGKLLFTLDEGCKYRFPMLRFYIAHPRVITLFTNHLRRPVNFLGVSLRLTAKPIKVFALHFPNEELVHPFANDMFH